MDRQTEEFPHAVLVEGADPTRPQADLVGREEEVLGGRRGVLDDEEVPPPSPVRVHAPEVPAHDHDDGRLCDETLVEAQTREGPLGPVLPDHDEVARLKVPRGRGPLRHLEEVPEPLLGDGVRPERPDAPPSADRVLQLHAHGHDGGGP